MNSSHNNKFYILAFALAAALRFIQLGALPLTDAEAQWALQALSVAQGGKPLLGPQPGYILLTSLLFFIFESANFLARFWPALAGSLLVFAPWFFRKQFGERVALILAFFLAMDPGLVAISRTADGMMLALAFLLLAWAMWQNERPQWAGILGGIALLGGPSIWAGMLGLGLSWAIMQNIVTAPETESSQNGERIRREDFKVAAMYGGGTILVVGTLFLLSPNGLGAWLTSLEVYIRGWLNPSGVPATRLLLALLVYQPLALIFGIIGAVRGWMKHNRHAIAFSLWFLIMLVLALAYPARQSADLIWVLPPLWALAAGELSRHLRLPEIDRSETFGVAALSIVLLIFAWVNLTGMALIPAESPMLVNRLILLVGSLLLLGLSLALVAVGWATETATLGGVWGTVTMLGIYTLGAAWGATGLRTPLGVELWDSGPRVPQAGLLLETIDETSTWFSGDAHNLSVTISGVDSPALRWLLRHREVIEADFLDFTSAPPMALTPQTNDLSLASSYRGQDFVWRQVPNWDLDSKSGWPTWLTLRQVSQNSEKLILWVRNDLFFDGQESVGQEAGNQ